MRVRLGTGTSSTIREVGLGQFDDADAPVRIIEDGLTAKKAIRIDASVGRSVQRVLSDPAGTWVAQKIVVRIVPKEGV